MGDAATLLIPSRFEEGYNRFLPETTLNGKTYGVGPIFVAFRGRIRMGCAGLAEINSRGLLSFAELLTALELLTARLRCVLSSSMRRRPMCCGGVRLT